MGLIDTLLAPVASGGPWAPSDDRWFQPIGPPSATGQRITPARAMRSPTFFRCVNLIADLVAGLPLQVFRQLDDDGRELAKDLPLYRTLHDAPNPLQTSREFRKELTLSMIVFGNGVAERIPSTERRGDYDLWPLDPGRTRIEVERGIKRFYVRRSNGQESVLLDDEVFHLVGYSHPGTGGYIGAPITDFATEAIALDLAMEAHGAAFFGNGSRPGGVLEHPSKLSADAQQRLKSDWEANHRGLATAHRVSILEEGMKYHATTVDNEASQWNESRETSELRIARFIGVPPNLLGLQTKDTSWGSGLAETNIRFMQLVVSPFLENWEQRAGRSLLTEKEQETYFVEHNTRAMMRMDDKTRAESYATARQWGWLSVNDIRRLENQNALDSGGDEYLRPVNMVDVNAPPPEPAPPALPPAGPPEPAAPPPPPKPQQGAHHALLLEDAAARVVRREIAALGRVAKVAASPEAWAEAVGTFYGEHGSHVASTMHVPMSVAGAYCAATASAARAGGVALLEQWEARPGERIAIVKALALEEA